MVGISLLTLVPGRHGGSETATADLLRTLARTGTLPYRVFVPPVAPAAGEGLPSELVTEYRRAERGRESVVAIAAAAARPGPVRRRLAAAALVHYPLTVRVPAPDGPSVVTLHDLQHLDLPELFSAPRRLFRSLAYHRSARAADRVVVPSAFVRDRAVALLGLANVRVIHHGIDHSRFRRASVERESFLLYPARPWPHKNHDQLYKAFALIRRERPDLRLVLTGSGLQTPPGEGIEARGQVSDEELVSLYQRAAALVFPSRYEGFGQPPLEAMACGCVVACSAIPALAEVCGDAAHLFEPEDPASIAAAVLELLEEPEPWRERGLARAARFTWERAAAAYEAVYRELL